MTVCNGVTVTKMCAFIVSSDTVHLKSPNANLCGIWGLAAQHVTHPLWCACRFLPVKLLSQSLWGSPSFSPVEDCIMKINHVTIILTLQKRVCMFYVNLYSK